jgi:hypothetical protein
VALVALLATGCGGGGGAPDSAAGSAPPSSSAAFSATTGVAQKGPLQSGSTVSAQELDSKLSPTGKQYTYQITSNLGTFEPSSAFGSQYIGLTASGYYLDEVTNAVSTGQITLMGYSDLSTDTVLNVNLLTTLAYQRIQFLVANSGLTFAAAKKQAEGEVLKAFHIPNPSSYGSFGTLDLSKTSDGDHVLAAISSILDYGNTAGNLSALIASIEADIKTNGAITNPATQAVLAASAKALNPAMIAANLTQAYSAAGVSFTAANIGDWIDQDGDGIVGGAKFKVPDATQTSTFTFPSFVTDPAAGSSISAAGGRLSVNGAVVTGPATIKAGDTVSVSPAPGTFPNGLLTVYLLSDGSRIGRVAFVSGLVSITVTPSTANLPVGLTQPFVATGSFTDGSTATLTANVSWSSSTPSVAAINGASGLAGAVAVGTATVTATSGSTTGSTTVTVVPAALESISLTPSPLAAGVGIVRGLAATGVYSDGTSANLTGSATWSSTSPSVATVTGGMVTGVTLGSTTVAASVGGVSGTAPVNVVTNTWTDAAYLPLAVAAHTATLLQSGMVLVAGGSNGYVNMGAGLANTEIYDPARDAWTPAANMLAGKSNHTATLLNDGRVLVVGGSDDSANVTAAASIYDPIANTWTAAPGMSTPRTTHTATLLPDGRVLIAGGPGTQYATPSSEIFDPVSNTWGPPTPMLVQRGSHTATLLSSGKVLVTGGQIGGIPTATTEVYDPTTNSWSAGPSMSVARMAHTATTLPTGIVLVAGSGGYGFVPSAASAETYDPTTNSWSSVASMATPRDHATATLLPSGRVLVAGGFNSGGHTQDLIYLSSAELFDPNTGTWTAAASMGSTHVGHRASLLPNGVVLVTGGSSLVTNGNPTAVCEMYW